MNDNQIKIKTKLELLEARELTISDALYISLILDNINTQIIKIKSILLNLETAISFASLNIMHNTILNEFQLKELLDKIPKNNLIRLGNPISYYKIMSPDVKVLNKKIIFAIHIPIINPKPFTLYKIIPIPILNRTIITPKPYMLLNEEKHLSLDKECPKVENTFICNQDEVSTDDSCVVSILTENKNTCPMVNVHYTRSSITRISDREILIVPAPATPASITNHCTKLKRLSTITDPTLIILDQCQLEIGGQVFEQEKSDSLYFTLDMPKLEHDNGVDRDLIYLEIQEVNHKELTQANQLVSALKLREMQRPEIFAQHWTIPLSTLFAIAIVGLVWVTCKLRKTFTAKRRKHHNEAEIELPQVKTSENRVPLFSES